MPYVFSKADTVWLGVANLVTKIMQETGALKAYSMCCQETNNEFLKIAEDTIYRQLLMDISKFFDRPTIAGNMNCSIPQLRKMCLRETSKFVEGENDCLIKEIDDLIKLFEDVISKELRNKKLAHFDLEELFAFNQHFIIFGDVENLVVKLGNVISEVGARLMLVEVNYPTIDAYARAYCKAIEELHTN